MLPVGSVLAQRYRIVRQMARGGMSNIYLCEDQRLTGKKWVVKELDAQYQDPKERENAKIHFEREASLLANLEHRNLPKVIDYFHENGKHHLVMEFVDGEDMSRILSKSGHRLAHTDRHGVLLPSLQKAGSDYFQGSETVQHNTVRKHSEADRFRHSQAFQPHQKGRYHANRLAWLCSA
jgi:serine/threonine protein kinase